MFSANSSQVSDDKLFVEDVFSTYLYTGNGSTQTITNGIDLAGKGGLVWTKNRVTPEWHCLADTTRGLGNNLFTNDTAANQFQATGITSASSTGYTIGSWIGINATQANVSWTFRKAPKFFDVVTYTGNGANRNIAHSLGVAPGCIIIKETSSVLNYDWQVYHRGMGASGSMQLNKTNADGGSGFFLWNNTAPTETSFTLGSSSNVNHSGATYVAYLYAHDATADGVIQCGSFTTNGSGVANVTLGWEPQWVMIKRTDTTGNWTIYDNMRGMPVSGYGSELYPNTAGAEALGYLTPPNATGFSTNLPASATYIYMAIRRPMKTPTLGTSVFAPVAWTGTGGTATIPAGFTVDLVISKSRNAANPPAWFDRLRGPLKYLGSSNIGAESSLAGSLTGFDNNTGVTVGADTSGGVINYSSRTFAEWMFRRAPGFFDVVCYTGNFSFRAINHNLGVVPELIITKARTDSNAFPAWYTPTTLGASTYDQLLLQDTGGSNIYSYGFGSSLGSNPTSELIYLGQNDQLNGNGPYVAYLFASCPGVSKVGNYTGNGSSQTINCGFAAGARFVMIKRTGSINSDWYVWDTARGIVAGNDPHLSLNTTASEVTTDDTIDTDSSGFVVNQVAATNANVNFASYIYLAIA
jgi:hypothetical protein